MSQIVTIDSNNTWEKKDHGWIINEPCSLYGTSQPFTKLVVKEWWDVYEYDERILFDEQTFPIDIMFNEHKHSVANVYIDTADDCYVKLYVLPKYTPEQKAKKLKKQQRREEQEYQEFEFFAYRPQHARN